MPMVRSKSTFTPAWPDGGEPFDDVDYDDDHGAHNDRLSAAIGQRQQEMRPSFNSPPCFADGNEYLGDDEGETDAATATAMVAGCGAHHHQHQPSLSLRHKGQSASQEQLVSAGRACKQRRDAHKRNSYAIGDSAQARAALAGSSTRINHVDGRRYVTRSQHRLSRGPTSSVANSNSSGSRTQPANNLASSSDRLEPSPGDLRISTGGLTALSYAICQGSPNAYSDSGVSGDLGSQQSASPVLGQVPSNGSPTPPQAALPQHQRKSPTHQHHHQLLEEPGQPRQQRPQPQPRSSQQPKQQATLAARIGARMSSGRMAAQQRSATSHQQQPTAAYDRHQPQQCNQSPLPHQSTSAIDCLTESPAACDRKSALARGVPNGINSNNSHHHQQHHQPPLMRNDFHCDSSANKPFHAADAAIKRADCSPSRDDDPRHDHPSSTDQIRTPLQHSASSSSVMDRVKSLEQMLGLRRNCSVKMPRTVHTVAAKAVPVIADQRHDSACLSEFNLNSGKDTTAAVGAVPCYARQAFNPPAQPPQQPQQPQLPFAAAGQTLRNYSLANSRSAPALRPDQQHRARNGLSSRHHQPAAASNDPIRLIEQQQDRSSSFGSAPGTGQVAVLRKRPAQPASVLRLESSRPKPDPILEQRKQQLKSARIRAPDAISDFEQLFNNLGLDDEDLLDRAERRDLPERLQLMLRNGGGGSSPPPPARGTRRHSYHHQEYAEDTLEEDNDEFSDGYSAASSVPLYENVGVLMKSASDISWHGGGLLTNGTTTGNLGAGNRARQLHYSRFVDHPTVQGQLKPRTPPFRRSAVPDIVSDDLAVRRLAKPVLPNGNGPQMFKAPDGQRLPMPSSLPMPSYLLVSHAHTPAIGGPALPHEPGEPDIERDDLCYRRLTQADAAPAHVPPPDLPFGIPKHPVLHHPATGYVHAELGPKERNLFSYTIRISNNPHLVRDDLAYRKLRKDPVAIDPGRQSPPMPPVSFANLLKNTKRQLKPTRSLSTANLNAVDTADCNSNYWRKDNWQSMTDIRSGAASTSARTEMLRLENLEDDQARLLRLQQQRNQLLNEINNSVAVLNDAEHYVNRCRSFANGSRQTKLAPNFVSTTMMPNKSIVAVPTPTPRSPCTVSSFGFAPLARSSTGPAAAIRKTETAAARLDLVDSAPSTSSVATSSTHKQQQQRQHRRHRHSSRASSSSDECEETEATRPPSSASSLASPLTATTTNSTASQPGAATEDYRLNSMLNNLLDDMKKREIFGVKSVKNTAENFWPRIGQDPSDSMKSILKKKQDSVDDSSKRNGILKRNSFDSKAQIHPILKRNSRDDITASLNSTTANTNISTTTAAAIVPQPPREIHSILKKSSSEETREEPRRPILKKSSFDDGQSFDKDNGIADSVRPILKTLKTSRYRGESKSESDVICRSIIKPIDRRSEPTTPAEQTRIVTQEDIEADLRREGAFTGPFVARTMPPIARRKSHPASTEESRTQQPQPPQPKLNKQSSPPELITVVERGGSKPEQSAIGTAGACRQLPNKSLPTTTTASSHQSRTAPATAASLDQSSSIVVDEFGTKLTIDDINPLNGGEGLDDQELRWSDLSD